MATDAGPLEAASAVVGSGGQSWGHYLWRENGKTKNERNIRGGDILD